MYIHYVQYIRCVAMYRMWRPQQAKRRNPRKPAVPGLGWPGTSSVCLRVRVGCIGTSLLPPPTCPAMPPRRAMACIDQHFCGRPSEGDSWPSVRSAEQTSAWAASPICLVGNERTQVPRISRDVQGLTQLSRCKGQAATADRQHVAQMLVQFKAAYRGVQVTPALGREDNTRRAKGSE